MDLETVYLTPRDVARRLKVSERTVRRWIASGLLRGRRFGHQFRIPIGAVEAMADAAEPIEAAEPWSALALDGFAEDWDNDLDAEYDDWRERYGVPAG